MARRTGFPHHTQMGSFQKGVKTCLYLRLQPLYGFFRKYAQVVETTRLLERRIFIIGGGRCAGHECFVSYFLFATQKTRLFKSFCNHAAHPPGIAGLPCSRLRMVLWKRSPTSGAPGRSAYSAPPPGSSPKPDSRIRSRPRETALSPAPTATCRLSASTAD